MRCTLVLEKYVNLSTLTEVKSEKQSSAIAKIKKFLFLFCFFP